MSDTIERVKLEVGKTYRVLKEGCRLSRTVSIATNCWTDKKELLPVGANVEFVGYKNCWGSDPIPVPNFRFGDVKGEFWPNDWGSIHTDVLAPVEEGIG